MKKINDISELKEKVGLLIGNFDGVHLGHQKLISDTINDCHKNSLKLLVVSFTPHPVQILKPCDNFLINTYEERVVLLKGEGIDYFMEIPFCRDLSTLGPKQFLDEYLFKNELVRKIYLGYDFVFGANKEGDSKFVAKYCESKNIEFSSGDKHTASEGDVSSSIVRKAISDGNIELTNSFLKRVFFLKGRVIKGEGRGKKIGIPTANLDFSQKRITPKRGVYITQTKIKDMTYNSVTNIGLNPTFKDTSTSTVETHLLDFDLDIYGEEIEVHFLKRIRDEKKFESVNFLIDQITEDVNSARVYFRC